MKSTGDISSTWTKQPETWRVGDLARQAGVSIRTLHYYDEIGILSPSSKSEGGHRLYTSSDIARLQQIRSLQEIGFSLEEIRECLESPEFSLAEVIRLHVQRLREEIARKQRVCSHLEMVDGQLRAGEEIPTEEFIQLIREINMVEKYYSPEQLEELRQRREALGEDGMRKAENDWQVLMEEVRVEMERGTDPSDPRVQELARRWMDLVNAFTGGNPEIAKSLRKLYDQEETVHGRQTGPMREMGEYISKAMAASRDV